MTDYSPPIEDMLFTLQHVAQLDQILGLDRYADVDAETIPMILEEAGKFGANVLAPINQSGDQTGARLSDDHVVMPDGFKQAYAAFVQGGWNGMTFDPDTGGQGLPWALGTAVSEIWHAANMSFGLCPMLTTSCAELLNAHGSPEQKQTYLKRIVVGDWTGTMNLTEPHAGSDLSDLRTKAVQDGDIFRITGQKVYITYGDHDMSENIVHAVLARTPDAPDGVKGISLFIVPKYLVNADGSLGRKNDVNCTALEQKLGIHASPTAVMQFGEVNGAIGYLVGEEGRGLEYMFTMMNVARLSVGLEGVAIAERAYQQAHAYALERRQGRAPGTTGAIKSPIIDHPDVRRMLLSMRAHTEAMRCLTYFTTSLLDHAGGNGDSASTIRAQALLDLLTPIVKSMATDIGVSVASEGIQVHGGVGFIESTGAAQHYRDARIAPIYEGTNGIQAIDLLQRKVVRDAGETAYSLIRYMSDDLGKMRARHSKCEAAIEALEASTRWVVDTAANDIDKALCAATPYLKIFGHTVASWLMVRAFDVIDEHPNTLYRERKKASVRYFVRQYTSQIPSWSAALEDAADAVTEANATLV